MWHIVRTTTSAPQENSTIEELLISATRSIMVFSGVFTSICTLIIAGNSSSSTMAILLGILTLNVIAIIFSFSLLATKYLYAQILWQLSLAVTIFSIASVTSQPEITLLSALLPLIAVVTLNWPGGVIAELG